MAKTGRNDPCHCRSGKKYKRCCLEKEAAAESAARETEQAARAHQHEHDGAVCNCCGTPGMRAGRVSVDDGPVLDKMSNGVIDLVKNGKLDEAERAAHALLERFPQMHDGYDRLGMVYEARGDNKQAASYYRKVIGLVRAHPDDYDPRFADRFNEMAERLDPTAV
jgi:tetratricopeptide (TPR) repeat protein